MLHLAQITIDRQKNCCQLLVMASCQPDRPWRKNCFTLPLTDAEPWLEGSLVLVETDGQRQIKQIQDGLDWLLPLLANPPGPGEAKLGAVPPSLLEQEKQQVEAWRQEMAAKNLELTRQQIELETQRQQLKQQEQALKGNGL